MATPRLFAITVIDAPLFLNGRYPKIYLPVHCCSQHNGHSIMEASSGDPLYSMRVIDVGKCNWNQTVFLRVGDLPKHLSELFSNNAFNYSNSLELWEKMNHYIGVHTDVQIIQLIRSIQKCCMSFEELVKRLGI